MGHPRLLEVLEREAELLASTARDAPREARVPGCPGLTLGETLRHVGSVYRLVGAWLADEHRPRRRPEVWQREPEQGQDLEDYLRAGIEALLGPLREVPPEEICTTWWPEDPTCGFWRRRMVHETTVHRVDVQGAAGLDVDPVPADIAVDGIDEVLTLWFERRLELLGVTGTRQARVAVRCGETQWLTATGGTVHHSTRTPWPARGACGEGASAAADDTGDGESLDAVVSANADQLYLWLWGRLPPNAVTRSGDEEAIAQLWTLLRLATR